MSTWGGGLLAAMAQEMGQQATQVLKQALAAGKDRVDAAIARAKEVAKEIAKTVKKVAHAGIDAARKVIKKTKELAKDAVDTVVSCWRKGREAEHTSEALVEFGKKELLDGAKKAVEIGFESKTEKTGSLLKYGPVDILTVSASKKSAISYSPDEKKVTITPISLEASAAVVKYEDSFQSDNKMAEAKLGATALSAKAELTPLAVELSPEGLKAKAELSAEAMLVKGEAEGKIKVSPKSLFDSTAQFFGSDVKAPAWLDHGIGVIAKGEAGIGAAAKASASAAIGPEGVELTAELAAGLGPMLGGKLGLLLF